MNKKGVQAFTCLPNPLKTLPAVIRKLLITEAIGAIFFGSLPLAHANPTGSQVVAGNAAIVEQGARMDINQASQRAVINWRSFSIEQGEHVNFNQPGRDSATLNRVVGNDPSAILGRMTANGNVYLINQNGIMVGKDAQINVGSLIASTANISNEDFIAGKNNFNEPGNPDARIVNYGNITVHQGGLVALVAPGVENHGAINARLGKIALAGGEAFTLDLYGDRLINLTVSKEQLDQISTVEGKPLSHYVSNTGEITADGGIVTIMAGTGKTIIDSLINLQGHVQAQTVANRNGIITLLGDDSTQVNVAGTLDASGRSANAEGGKVEIRAGENNLQIGSRIDVSGHANGGTALIGGDFQGSGEGVRAQNTTVSSAAVIDADSKIAGNGGKVIVWADSRTHFDGRVSARGGSESGNGGLVEVSGKNTLYFNGDVDASAPHGKAGQLLLDPGDLVVKDMTAEENQAAAKPDAQGAVSASTDDASVNVQKVNYLLQNGTSVSLQASNDLTVAAQIDGRATGGVEGADISLSAGRNANINENVLTNNGAITVKAETGNITMAAGKVLHAGNEVITLDAGGNIVAEHLVSAGKIDLKADGNVSLNQTLAGDPINNIDGIGALTIDAKNNVALKGGVVANGAVNVASSAGSIIAEEATTIAARSAPINLAAAQDLTLANLTTGGKATLSATNGNVTSKGSIAAGDLALTAKTNINLKDACVAKDLACSQTDSGLAGDDGSLTLSAGGDLIHTGTFIADRNLTLKADNGNMALGQVDVRKSGAAFEARAKAMTLNGNVITSDGTQSYVTTNGDFILAPGSSATPNRLDSGKAKISIDSQGEGDVTLNGTLLSTQAGVKVTTAAGDVAFNQTLGYADRNDNPDPTKAVGSVQVEAGGKITIDKDWNIAGNNVGCDGGDCSVKIIQSGNNDIVINGRIKTVTGNILIGQDNLQPQNFSNQKIELGNSIFAEGQDAKITIAGNLELVPTERTDELIRTRNTFNGIQQDTIPAVSLSARNGSINISGKISGLWKFLDAPSDPNNPTSSSWNITSENNGGLALRLVVKDDAEGSLGFNVNSGIMSNRLFDANGNTCCDKIFSSFGDGFNFNLEPSYAFINQYGETIASEFHYVVLGGVIKDNDATSTGIDAEGNPFGTIYDSNIMVGKYGSFQLSEFNQIQTSVAPEGQNSSYVGIPEGSAALNPDAVSTDSTGSTNTDSSSITKQTLNYADQQQQDSGNEDSSEEVVILGGGSDADNADLGRDSPESGATQSTYSNRHYAACINSQSIKAQVGVVVPSCKKG